MNKKLKKTFKKFDKDKENKQILISGELGIALDGARVVEVPGRRGFVYVRLKGNTSELIQAYNATVPPVYDLPVFVVRQGGIYKVVGRNIERHTNQWGTAAYLPKHGAQHSFNHDLNVGGDVVWVYSQQFMPLLTYPSGSVGSMVLNVEPSFYEWQGSWRYSQNTGTPDYTPYLPTTTDTARMVLSYIEPSSNAIRLVPGTPFSASVTGSSQVAQYIPDIPRSIGIPLAAVRLVTGTTSIGWDAIYDVRDFYHSWNSSGTSGGGAGVDTIGFAGLDEGVPIGTGTFLNVTGDLSFSRSGTMFNLSYTSAGGGGGGGVGGIMGWDEGIPVGTGTVLNVTGESLALSISGTVLNINLLGAGRVLLNSSTPNGTGTVSFSNIPSTYKNLEVEFVARHSSPGAAQMAVYMNNDTTAGNYRGTSMYGFLTTSVAAAGADGSNVGASCVPGSDSPTGSFAVVSGDILNYTSIYINKTFKASGAVRHNVTTIHELVFTYAQEWENTAAVNRLDFVLSAGNYVAGSEIRLYGIQQ